MKTKQKFKRYALLGIGLSVLLLATTAKADNQVITEPTDVWFEFSEPTTFTVRTWAIDGYWSDPMLWLYDTDGQIVAVNDDWFGLQSNISIDLQPGMYRLRAGVCCGDPNRWYQDVRYTIDTNTSPVMSTTVETWQTTTTMNTVPPTSEPTTTTTSPPTSTSPTSSSTTTTLPDPPTTTSTTNPVTSTVQSTTTTENSSPSTVFSSASLPPSTTLPMLTTSTTTTKTTTTTTTTSTTLPFTVSSLILAPETTANESVTPSSTASTLDIPQVSEPVQTYTQKVGIGPFKLTLTVTEAQRTTVVAAAIVQITAVASISASGVSTGGSTTRRRR